MAQNIVGEIIGSNIYASPRPSARVASFTITLLNKLFSAFHDEWWFFSEPELNFGADVMVPDIAAWRKERLPVVPDSSVFTLAPDWVVEVLTPETTLLDRCRKRPAYARNGVAHLWVVHPGEGLEIYEQYGALYALVGVPINGEVICLEPFASVEVPVTHLWPTPPQN